MVYSMTSENTENDNQLKNEIYKDDCVIFAYFTQHPATAISLISLVAALFTFFVQQIFNGIFMRYCIKWNNPENAIKPDTTNFTLIFVLFALMILFALIIPDYIHQHIEIFFCNFGLLHLLKIATKIPDMLHEADENILSNYPYVRKNIFIILLKLIGVLTFDFGLYTILFYLTEFIANRTILDAVIAASPSFLIALCGGIIISFLKYRKFLFYKMEQYDSREQMITQLKNIIKEYRDLEKTLINKLQTSSNRLKNKYSDKYVINASKIAVITCLLLVGFIAYSYEKYIQEPDYFLLTSFNDTSYVVIAHNETTYVLKSAVINDSSISVYTKETTVINTPITVVKASFNNISIIDN